MKIIEENNLNLKVIEYLNSKVKIVKYKSSPIGEVNVDELLTARDNTEVLWNELTKKLPVKCQWVISDYAVLVNPNTGIIFGIMLGNFPPLLRLSAEQHAQIINTGGAKYKLSDLDGVYANSEEFGPDWIYCFSFIPNIKYFCLQAYEYSNII